MSAEELAARIAGCRYLILLHDRWEARERKRGNEPNPAGLRFRDRQRLRLSALEAEFALVADTAPPEVRALAERGADA